MNKQSHILKAAVVQQVHYFSADAMFRINARFSMFGVDVKYLSTVPQEDGSVVALIQFPYNDDKEMFDRNGLLDALNEAGADHRSGGSC